eukprot:scaffold1366_cov91-Cylindrotheca_fusiformis.AAC.4
MIFRKLTIASHGAGEMRGVGKNKDDDPPKRGRVENCLVTVKFWIFRWAKTPSGLSCILTRLVVSPPFNEHFIVVEPNPL